MSCTRKRLVDEQAGEHEQGRARNVEQGAHRIGENVIEPWPPAVRPDMPEGGHHAVGDDRLEIVRHAREGIEADRPLKVGGVEVDEIIRARAGDMRERGFGEVAMRIEESQALAGDEVLPDQIEQEGAFAGAGLADDVEMTAAFLRIEHDQFARRAGTDCRAAVMAVSWVGREPVCRAHRDWDLMRAALLSLKGAPGLHGVASLCVMTRLPSLPLTAGSFRATIFSRWWPRLIVSLGNS